MIEGMLLPGPRVLAGGLGFAAHRANVCTVRAVAEVLGSRRACLFLSFGKMVLWVMALALRSCGCRPSRR